MGLAELNTAALCKQDMLQALDTEDLKRAHEHKPAESSRAAACAEQCDRRCGHDFQAGERAKVQGKRAAVSGSISGWHSTQRVQWMAHTRERTSYKTVSSSGAVVL